MRAVSRLLVALLFLLLFGQPAAAQIISGATQSTFPLTFDGTNVTQGSGQLLLPNGTAGAPASSFTSDATTGVFYSGAGSARWALSTSGTGRLRGDSGGPVV